MYLSRFVKVFISSTSLYLIKKMFSSAGFEHASPFAEETTVWSTTLWLERESQSSKVLFTLKHIHLFKFFWKPYLLSFISKMWTNHFLKNRFDFLIQHFYSNAIPSGHLYLSIHQKQHLKSCWLPHLHRWLPSYPSTPTFNLNHCILLNEFESGSSNQQLICKAYDDRCAPESLQG